MNSRSPLVMPLLPASIAGIVSPEFDCVRVEIAAPDETYRILAGFIIDGAKLKDEPALAVCPEPVYRIDADGKMVSFSYNARRWLVVHRATGMTLSPAFNHFNLAIGLVRDLEVAANWERVVRGERPRKPVDHMPRWQCERVAKLITAALQAQDIVR